MKAAGKRQKGSRGERELVRILTEAGIPARRVPLSGAMWATGFGGDLLVGEAPVSHGNILFEAGTEVRWEVKRRRGFASIYKWLEDAAVLAFRGDRGEWVVVLRLDDYLKDRK